MVTAFYLCCTHLSRWGCMRPTACHCHCRICSKHASVQWCCLMRKPLQTASGLLAHQPRKGISPVDTLDDPSLQDQKSNSVRLFVEDLLVVQSIPWAAVCLWPGGPYLLNAGHFSCLCSHYHFVGRSTSELISVLASTHNSIKSLCT